MLYPQQTTRSEFRDCVLTHPIAPLKQDREGWDAHSLRSLKSVTTMLPPLGLLRAQITPRLYGATECTPLNAAPVGTNDFSGQQQATISPSLVKSTRLTAPSLWPRLTVLEVA